MNMDYDENVFPVEIKSDGPILEDGNKEKEATVIDLENQQNVVKETTNSKKYIPEEGMEFDTEEEAYNFYNAYAASMGFSIRRTGKKGDPIVYRKFCCSAQGLRQPDKRDVYYKKHRPETRTNCGACMTVNARFTGKFKVMQFVPDHNGHPLVKKVGGREKVGYLLEDLKNYLRSKRTIQMPDGDAGGLLNYLQLKQSKDPNFFNAIQVDEDDLITNIFWADGQMMADYMYFGDVVCFDTTYRKNKEDRPFGLFVGVNHHRQTVVFGAAFLYDETAETFKWLFATFEEAMNGRKPETIFTDQDAAMAKALEEVWHGTYHRLCIWHIYQNAAKNLSYIFNKFSDFVQVFKNCIYSHEVEEDFLKAWDNMLVKYELQDNDWLIKLFSKKEKWALVYGRQHFCADILSTQRSESMNSVLKRYVSHKSNLLLFFGQFERLIEDRRYEELREDTRNNQSKVHLSNEFEILKHAREVYTHKSFLVFQAELIQSYDAKKRKIFESENIYRYEVTPLNIHYHCTVTYDASDNTIVCSCKKFEFAGILCSHALKILAEHNVVRIPDLYIKKRWTKSAKKGILEGFSQPVGTSTLSSDNLKEAEEKLRHGEHYRELCRIFSQLSTRASRADDTFEFAKAVGYKALQDVDAIFDNKQVTQTTTATSYVVKNTLVSRVTKKQCATDLELNNQEVEARRSMDNGVRIAQESSPEAETIIRGLKKKETSKVKSGKRLKNGLEEAVKKRQPKNKKNVNVVSSGLTGTSTLQTTLQQGMIPFLQASQNNQVIHPYWSSPHFPRAAPYFPNEHGVSNLSRSQIRLVNPNIPHQLNYYPQFPNNSITSNGHLNNTSMGSLLQAQVRHGQEIGRCPRNGSISNTREQLARDVDGSA
ncbi:hypothetical protein OROGR_002633 [Orobanche gracilis]